MGCSKSEGIIWYGEVSGEYDGWGWNEAPVVIYTTDHNNRFGISIGEERPLEFDIRNHSGNGVNHVYRLHMVKDKGEWVSGSEWEEVWIMEINKAKYFSEPKAYLYSPDYTIAVKFKINKEVLP